MFKSWLILFLSKLRYIALSCITVAIYNNARQCWKKRFPLALRAYDYTRTRFTKALIKVRKEGFLVDFNGNTGGKKRIPILQGAVLLGSSVFFNGLLLLAISLLVFVWRKRKDAKIPPPHQELTLSPM